MPEHPDDVAIYGAQDRRALAPPGGPAKYALVKDSPADYDYSWHPVALDDSSSAASTPTEILGIMISDLDAATTLTGTELVPIVQGSNTVRTTTAAIANLGASSVVFSYPGALDNNVESPRYYPKSDITYTRIRVSLLANATTNHVIQLRVGGALVSSHTLTAGNATVTAAISVAVAATSYVTIKTTTVSDSDLSVQLSA